MDPAGVVILWSPLYIGFLGIIFQMTALTNNAYLALMFMYSTLGQQQKHLLKCYSLGVSQLNA